MVAGPPPRTDMSERIVPQRRFVLIDPTGLIQWWSHQLSAQTVIERATLSRDQTWEQLQEFGFRVVEIEAREVEPEPGED